MIYRPILMSPPMVRATYDLLQKIETRRLSGLDQVNHEPSNWRLTRFEGPDKKGRMVAVFEDVYGLPFILRAPCPYGAPGDLLWVRENWAVGKGYDDLKTAEVCKLLDNQYLLHWHESSGWDKANSGKIRPSIHMPRKISQHTLKLLGVRVERLQDITEEAAQMEGAQCGRLLPYGEKDWQLELGDGGTYLDGFRYIWFTINDRASWDANPWVWVLRYAIHS